MVERFFVLSLFVFAFLLTAPTAIQAKTLPQTKSGGKAATFRSSPTSGITVSPKLRGDRKALLVNFGNLQNANSVMYSLSYKTGGQEEGIGGTITPAGSSATRELLFGTCSKNVCRYHGNITNARFEIQTSLKNGKISVKRYRIRV